jgi:hypothetical protein
LTGGRILRPFERESSGRIGPQGREELAMKKKRFSVEQITAA